MIEFLLLSYGLTFGLMNKLPSKVYEVPPVEVGEHPEPIWVRLLRCSYCVGFWSGIIAYILLCAGRMEHWPSSGGGLGFLCMVWWEPDGVMLSTLSCASRNTS